MARTLSNAPVASVNLALSDIYGMQICKMREVQIKGKKLEMPKPINRNMDAQARALIFYTTVSKLGQHKRVLSPSDMIGHLADVCNLASVNDNNIEVLTEDYNAQLFVPDNFRVVSFNNDAGQVVNTTTTVDPQILKGTGGMDAATAPADRRVANIKFVTVETTIDFTLITQDDKSKFKVTTVIELPMTSKQVNGKATGAIGVMTFQDEDDIRTYSSEDFED